MQLKGSSLFSMESLRPEAPNPKHQAPKKFQAPNLNAPFWIAQTLVWSLRLELLWSLIFGAWCFAAGRNPTKTARNQLKRGRYLLELKGGPQLPTRPFPPQMNQRQSGNRDCLGRTGSHWRWWHPDHGRRFQPLRSAEQSAGPSLRNNVWDTQHG